MKSSIDISEDTEVSTGFIPRKIQRELFNNLRRFNVIVMHRRAGKSVFCINLLIDRALRHTMPMPRFFYIAPTYSAAKRIAWDYLKKYSSMIPGVQWNEADLRIDLPNGARITLLSAENPASLRGIYADGVILDEFSEMNPVVWSTIIRPTLSDRKGWAIFISTPKGQNTFFELKEYADSGVDPDWFTATYKASETGLIPEDELEALKKEMTEDEYLQEFECSFNAGLVGAYFAKELTKAEETQRITRVSHDPMLPVDMYFDLGFNDMAAVWFVQTLRGRHRLIRYFEVSGLSIAEFVAEIKKIVNSFGGDFGEWVFPHDAQAASFQTGKTQLQVFHSLGCRPTRVIPRVGAKRESINAARMIFGACEFDAEGCKRGLKALANYQRKWDAKNNVFSETPLHNWASNGADAFQQFALGVREGSRDNLGMGNKFYDGKTPLQADTKYNPFDRRRTK